MTNSEQNLVMTTDQYYGKLFLAWFAGVLSALVVFGISFVVVG